MVFPLHLSSLSCYMSTISIQFIDILTHENDMQMESVVSRLSDQSWQLVRTLWLTNRPASVPLFSSLFHSSLSITQPWHEYKWRLVKSRDWVPVNGFLLGLRQQRTPNGFSLTGFNHVPWYPLKRMQIVNQPSPLPSRFSTVFTSFPAMILQSLALLLPPFPPSDSLLNISRTSHFPVRLVSICPNKLKWTSSLFINVCWESHKGHHFISLQVMKISSILIL